MNFLKEYDRIKLIRLKISQNIFDEEVEDYLTEQFLSGKKSYWHGYSGIINDKEIPRIEKDNMFNLGNWEWLFFTSHFGYSLIYAFRANLSEKSIEQIAELINYDYEDKRIIIDIREFNPKRLISYIFPLKMKSENHIFDIQNWRDCKDLLDLKLKNPEKYKNNKFLKYIDSMESRTDISKQISMMRSVDWFNIPGIRREDILDCIHARGYDGFYNFEVPELNNTKGFHSVGLYKDKLDSLLLAKPIKAEIKKENENYYINLTKT